MAKLGHKNIIYQPIHGSESKLKGKNLANPIGAISAVALMFELSFGLHEASKLIDVAINRALNQGYKTIDLAMPNEPFSHTNQVTEAVIKNLSGFHSFIAKATLLNQQDFIYPEGL
jgi:3-isopropylmalate dehydrogenase